jgi:regulator of nucleoside diphosphate kinase
MSKTICITQTDKVKLLDIIEDAKYIHLKTNQYIKDLEAEIKKATVIGYEQLPKDVITMNSKVILSIDHEEEEITLVYPNEADVKQNKISILSPIGTAILGYSEGSLIEWKVPSGIVKIEVKKVIFQPEAMGLYHL